jgi:hypothetical protein
MKKTRSRKSRDTVPLSRCIKAYRYQKGLSCYTIEGKVPKFTKTW